MSSPDANLENAGGKGVNLSKLIRAGFNVPGGFILTTQAYKSYINTNKLGDRILERIYQIDDQDAVQLEEASTEIRSWFQNPGIPQQITDQLKEAYAHLGEDAVAVRSSATAEDLPDISFAGQQDTFLNITDFESLLQAVTDCWSSLWTARAISYRDRNNIPQDEVYLAVIVQEMVPSESSGIMFTANPLTGSRTELVIDATLGLGEALVAGHVEPDHYVVEKEQRKILSKSLGSKSVIMQGKSGGGVQTQEADASETQAISDEMILSLVDIGVRINDLYQFPQDIEWAFSGGKLFILQSRPITSLFPIPEGIRTTPLRAFFSFAAVQGILEPMTPLGQDAVRLIFAGAASMFDFDVTQETQGVFRIAGERLWAEITTVVHHPIGSRLMLRFMSAIDQVVQHTLIRLKDDPSLEFGEGRLRFSTLKSVAKFVFPFLKGVFGFIKSPQGAAEWIQQSSQAEIARIRDKYSQSPDSKLSLKESVNLYGEIFNAFPFAIPHIATGAAAGLIPFFLLNKISTQLTGTSDLGLEITRGLPNNVTTEMDLYLWEVAQIIRTDEDCYKLFMSSDSGVLANDYLGNKLPEPAQSQISTFLDTYGMRGLGEIDIGRTRWREQPDYVFEVMRSYLQIEDETLAPDVVFNSGKKAAEDAINTLQGIAKRTFAGRMKAEVIGMLAVRVRELAGLRESPKFFIVQLFGIIRQALLESGEELVLNGTFDCPDDIFYLYLTELEALANGESRDWRSLIAERRRSYQRELGRKQIPRLLLSDGRAFYEVLESSYGDESSILGSPVSPGVVQGRVRVILDPINADLLPGEIMVCPGTDPAWTPLFLSAVGLIMEVGGMMTHGAIVAREYGIPAVVGVYQATTKFYTGQEIRVDGSTGEIFLLQK
ncbi:MAG: PEP/pyruvate-binding domain-containing protein [Anaerolineales bacterium]